MKKRNVAAYCRISSNHPKQESSLEIQIKYYRNYIAEHNNWILAGIYAECVSGTRLKNRKEMCRLLRDCRKGKVDLILTKSISRFGRNTLETIKILRELKQLGIEVIFEKEHLNNMNQEMIVMMEIYCAFAQEESKSMSENIKWGIRQKMRSGKVILNCTRFLGYAKDENGNLVVVPEEAEIVRKIFELYLQGFGVRKIKKYLEEHHIRTVTGKDVWSTSTIDRMLSNEKYAGDVLMQKTFTEDFLTGKRKKNDGELDMYFIENNHEGIVSREIFDKVQKMKKKLE